MGQSSSGQAAGQHGSSKQQDDTPFWCRYLAHAVGTLGGLASMVVGIFVLISIHMNCIVAGILSILNGCILVTMEAPCCCGFLDFIERIAQFSQNRSHWQKAAAYGILSSIPVFFCFGITSVASQIGTLLTAMLYAMLALGKKADRRSVNRQPDAIQLMEEQPQQM